MKTFTIITIIILIILLGFLTGMYLYKMKDINKDITIGTNNLKVEDECTEYAELASIGKLNLQTTDASENKVSPNSTLTIKKLFLWCNHIIEYSEKIPIELTNLNKEEVQEKYKDWEIQKFTTNEIVLYKEVNNFCGEHYLLKNVEGYIGIYELDKNDNEINLIKITEISTEYLTETDLIKIGNGMKIYTKKELNKILEDFE